MTTGYITAIRTKLLTIIAGADSSLSPQSTHVSADWKVAIDWLEDAAPCVTVRVNEAIFRELIYGKQIGNNKKGAYIQVPFSAHVWAEDVTTSGHMKSETASDLADKIINTLEKYTGDSTSGIMYFFNLTSRESEPDRGPQRLSRFIVEGYMMVKRPRV